MKRAAIAVLVIIAGTLLVLCTGRLGYVLHVFNSSDNLGSPKLAAEWKTELEGFTDYDDAHARYWRVQGANLRSGEWVFGYCNDSHGKLPGSGGGIVVVKDSRGDVRVFFGHVCGPDYLQWVADHSATLDVFYEHLAERVVEQPSD